MWVKVQDTLAIGVWRLDIGAYLEVKGQDTLAIGVWCLDIGAGQRSQTLAMHHWRMTRPRATVEQ